MDLTNETKTWLVERNIAPVFFPLLEDVYGGNLNLLDATTLSDMNDRMPGNMARFLFFKANPPKKLNNSIKHFLRSCGIDEEDERFIERLHPKSVEELKYIDCDDMTRVGTSSFRSKCVVNLLKQKNLECTPGSCLKENSEQVIEQLTFPPSFEVESAEDDDDESEDEKSVSDNSLTPKNKRSRNLEKDIDDGRKRRRRIKKTQNSISEDVWHAFKNAKKLHLGDYSKDLFYKYHEMFELKRKRYGTDKWLYQVNTGRGFQVVRALLPAMDLCYDVEKSRAIDSVENGASALESLTRFSNNNI